MAQGYGIARPMPAEQVLYWAATRKPKKNVIPSVVIRQPLSGCTRPTPSARVHNREIESSLPLWRNQSNRHHILQHKANQKTSKARQHQDSMSPMGSNLRIFQRVPDRAHGVAERQRLHKPCNSEHRQPHEGDAG